MCTWTKPKIVRGVPREGKEAAALEGIKVWEGETEAGYEVVHFMQRGTRLYTQINSTGEKNYGSQRPPSKVWLPCSYENPFLGTSRLLSCENGRLGNQ